MEKPTSLYQPVSDDIMAQVNSLLEDTTHAALGTNSEQNPIPQLSRILFCRHGDGTLLSLMSDLADHSRALKLQPHCGLLIGTPPEKGDPLAFARLSLTVKAQFVEKTDTLKTQWLHHHPKSQLYVDFADFQFVTFDIVSGTLNGGFGKAARLAASDFV